jgi:hypothetical protein
MNVKLDEKAKCLQVDAMTHLVRVDGIIVCKRIRRAGQVYLQFKDGDRMRSTCRGTQFVEVPLEAFKDALCVCEDELIWPYPI